MKRALLLIALLTFLLPTTSVHADAPPLTATAEKGTATRSEELLAKTATLKLDNRAIITFRSTLYGYSPAQRVEGALSRLKSVISLRMTGPVSTKKVADGTSVFIADHLIFIITPGDLDTLVGETQDEASRKATANLQTALAEREESQRADTFLRGVGYSGAATFLLFIVLSVIFRVHRWLRTNLAKFVGPRLKMLAIGGFTLHVEWFFTLLNLLVGLLALVPALSVLYLWLDFSFMQFPYTRPWGENLRDYMMAGISEIALTIVDFIPGLIIVVIIFFITRFIVRLVRLFFDAVEDGQVQVPILYAETAQPTRKIVTIVLWLFAVVMMYPYLPGSDSNAFKGVSVFVGLLLSIGSAGTVGQAVSGLMLMYTRALRVGDYVRIGETEGTVVTLGWFATRIRTPWSEIVSLPNAYIVGTTTKNYSHAEESGSALLTTTVTIGYSAPWRQVHAMLIEAARRTEGLLKDTPPQVRQKSLSDYYVEYMLCARIAVPETRIAVLDKIHRNIQDVFNEHGVQIMSPHYMADPAEKVWVPKENWFASPASKKDDDSANLT